MCDVGGGVDVGAPSYLAQCTDSSASLSSWDFTYDRCYEPSVRSPEIHQSFPCLVHGFISPARCTAPVLYEEIQTPPVTSV